MFRTRIIGPGRSIFSAALEVSAVRWWCVRTELAPGGRQAAQAPRHAGTPYAGPNEAN